MPKNFNIGMVKLLVKDQTKDPNDINNLRPLTISESWAIIFEKIILEEINRTLSLKSNQFGFRPKSLCGHAVNRNNLWGKMVSKVEPYILRTLINYYSVSKIVIVINDKTTSLIKTTSGVKQGGPLSPSLFSIYVDDLGDDLDQDDSGIKIG
ncbi:RNA-directed DNA polymerase from mobile element jockey-like [Brachionus plicatilis]|uniref:RNA-directed DNA polymerase from mobile element jockey-like n=1 Tax=Brachionus plicatilis TaxID=10195 RepID=A0A3M7SC84_BRAPC|nr:RNA-directed DNA polymerase from mobile element jockey-like [Brachionus plicatilis]